MSRTCRIEEVRYPMILRDTRGRRLGVGLAALALMAAACGDGDTAVADNRPESNPDSCDQGALDALYEAAKDEEGAVMWYFTNPPETIDPVIDAFAKAFPGESLEYQQLVGAGSVPARIIQELDAGRETADLGSGGS